MPTIPRRLWQAAGLLAIAHCVLIPICLALQSPVLFEQGVAGMQDYADGDLTRTFTGGILEGYAFLLLVPVVAFWGRALGRTTELGRWAAQTGVLCGLAYVTVTFAVGFPAGGAAMYGVQGGLDLETAFALNNVRVFAYFLSLMLLGGATLGFAVAALTDRLHPRWFGWFGVVTGIGLLASTPLASIGQQDWGTLVWLVWTIGAGVLMLRHRDRAEATDATTGSPAPRVTVGHS